MLQARFKLSLLGAQGSPTSPSTNTHSFMQQTAKTAPVLHGFDGLCYRLRSLHTHKHKTAKTYDSKLINDRVPRHRGKRKETNKSVPVGVAVGEAEGVDVGDSVGEAVGVPLGEAVGVAVGDSVGEADGEDVGVEVGDEEGDGVGETVGLSVGVPEGDALGVLVGVLDGDAVGVSVGVDDGETLGELVGLDVGVCDGVLDGLEVGVKLGDPVTLGIYVTNQYISPASTTETQTLMQAHTNLPKTTTSKERNTRRKSEKAKPEKTSHSSPKRIKNRPE